MRLAAVVAAALTIATAAAAASAPAGFTETPRLDTVAAYVSQKPAHIYCASTDAAWNTWITSMYGSTDPNGYTPTIGGDESELPPLVCRILLAKLTHSYDGTTFNLAASILILVHEAEHLRGVGDEGQAECQAIHAMPAVAVRFFGYSFTKRKPLRALMAQAWVSHRQKPAAYTSVC